MSILQTLCEYFPPNWTRYFQPEVPNGFVVSWNDYGPTLWFIPANPLPHVGDDKAFEWLKASDYVDGKIPKEGARGSKR